MRGHRTIETGSPALQQCTQIRWRQGLQRHGTGTQRRAQNGHQRAAGQIVARGAMQAFLPRHAQCPATLMQGEFRRIVSLFAHSIGRRHHHRAQRRRLCIIKPDPVHGDTEEASCTEGLQRRVDFFEVAARAFFAVIHAENQLRRSHG